MVPDENGQLQKYSAEWFNPSRLSKMNITKDTLKPGDTVIITGSPGRNVNERTLHLKRIQRPADERPEARQSMQAGHGADVAEGTASDEPVSAR